MLKPNICPTISQHAKFSCNKSCGVVRRGYEEIFVFVFNFFNFFLLDLNRRAHLIGDRMLDSPKEVSYSKQKLHA